ncbi:MAG: DUF3857 and transglutaminase domain-containing protein [Bacteroidales bacterium]|nr:DUF3857 and transglutaminase domain-containing protein [Bacteroidales bacterium]
MMRNKFQVFFLFLLACGVSGTAQDRVLPKYKPGTPFTTLFDSTHVVVEESGLSHVTNHRRILLLTNAGCKMNRTVKMDYDPLSAYVEIRQVVVYRHGTSRADTIVSAGKQSKVLDYVAPARLIYWGASQKMVQVGRLDVFDEVEIWTYRKGFTYALLGGDDDKYIPPMRGHYYDIVPFWSEQPIDEKVYMLDIPNSKSLQYEMYNGEVEHTQLSLKENSTRHVFQKKDIFPMYDAEPRMVAKNDVCCKLLLSTSPDWQAKSRWFYGVNEDYGSFKSTPEVAEKVAELLAPAKTEQDSISILTHWVADEIRYAGISMGPGEGYTLHNAEMNFTDRCGVCKDKAGMLVTMLRAAGFKAYAAMTMAGERIERIPADQFNHSVCVVRRRNGNYELLDPTWVPNVRELWSSAEQQQGYLMGLPEGADLMYTPLSPAENHYIKLKGKSKILVNGTLVGEFTITAEGQSDQAVRQLVFGGRMSEWQGNLERELTKIDPRAEIVNVKYTDPDAYLMQPVSITYKYKIPGYATVDGDALVFTPLLARLPYAGAMSHLGFNTDVQSRKYPFADRCSRLIEVSEEIALPDNYKRLAFTGEVRGVVHAAANFGCQYNLTEGGKTLFFGENAMLNKRIYLPEDWPAFRAVVQNQKTLQSTPVVLTK